MTYYTEAAAAQELGISTLMLRVIKKVVLRMATADDDHDDEEWQTFLKKVLTHSVNVL